MNEKNRQNWTVPQTARLAVVFVCEYGSWRRLPVNDPLWLLQTTSCIYRVQKKTSPFNPSELLQTNLDATSLKSHLGDPKKLPFRAPRQEGATNTGIAGATP